MTFLRETGKDFNLQLPPGLEDSIYQLLYLQTRVYETPSSTERVYPYRMIERKFLLAQFPPPNVRLENDEKIEICEGYLKVKNDEEISVRREGNNEPVLSMKRSDGTIVTTEIDEQTFTTLWQQSVGYQVEKIRYTVQHGGSHILIDVYQKAHGGLVRAKIKFDNENDSNSFDIPTWLGAEVTDEAEFRNKSLAVEGVPIPSIVESATHASDGIFADKFPENQMNTLFELISKSVNYGTLIQLGGRPSSGKSTVIDRIKGKFGADSVTVLQMDDYLFIHESTEEYTHGGDLASFYNPDSIRWSSLKEDILKYKTSGKIVIVEGPLALHLRLPQENPIKVFVDSNLRTGLFKWMISDLQRPHSQLWSDRKRDPISTIKYYLDHIETMYKRSVESTKRSFDEAPVHILTNTLYAPAEAGRWGTHKIHHKYQAPPHIVNQLFAIGATELGKVTHTDHYYRPVERIEASQDNKEEYMRVRVEGEHATLQYGNISSNNTMGPEVEYSIDAQTQDFLLTEFNFEPLRKKRSVYKIGNVIITLTEIETFKDGEYVHFKNYVELTCAFGEDIEGQMRTVAEKLNIDFEKQDNRPYSIMILGL